MSQHTEKLYAELREVLEKYGEETDMTHVEAIGVLQMLSINLAKEARDIIEADGYVPPGDDGDDLGGLDEGVPDGM